MRAAVGVAGVMLAGMVAVVVSAGGGGSASLSSVESSSGGAAAAVPAVSTDCVLPAGGTKLGLDADQVENARAIVAAAKAAGVGDAGARIGIATGLVEGQYTRGERGGPVEGLRNVAYGLGGSKGIFQELGGSGSGFALTDAQRMDVSGAATRFFTKLKGVKGWQSMDPGAAAQAVQRSSYPTKYARRMSEAQIIVAQVGGGSTGCTTTAAPAGAPANLAAALAWANTKAGAPYVWGGTGPTSWDCSGLTQDAFSRVGVKLPRVAEDQRAWLAAGHGTRVQPGSERPGDLLFSGSPAYHVVIVNDPSRKLTIEARQTCRAGMKGAGIDCGVGHFDYAHRIASGAQIWRINA